MSASPASSCIIEDTPSALRLTISSRKNGFLIAFLSLWVLAWAAGEAALLLGVGSALSPYFKGLQENQTGVPGPTIALLLVLWGALWTAGGVYALFTLLWQLAGKEVIEVTGEGIALSRKILGLGPTSTYPAGQIDRLREAPLAQVDWFTWRLLGPLGRSANRLAFDFGGHTILFGAALTAREARLVLAKIIERYPLYRPGEKS